MTSGDISAALVEVLVSVAEIDLACSRFRDDSELAAVNRSGGSYVPASTLFLQALDIAVDAARRTNGAVDPTIGSAIRVLGYDRTFSALDPDLETRSDDDDRRPTVRVSKVPGWQVIDIDRRQHSVRLPRGVLLDLGATTKGFAADRAARRAADATGAGVLVSLGGDIAVAGEAPPDGWLVGIADSHRAQFADADEAVCIWAGGLATSSTTVRRWINDGRVVHHLIDPRTGVSAQSPWRTVSVAAPSCAEANVCTTAAIVLGDEALTFLDVQGHPSRLVDLDGSVVRRNGWPTPESQAAAGR